MYTNKKQQKRNIEQSSKDQIKSIIDIGNHVSALAGQLSNNINRPNNHNDGATHKSGNKKNTNLPASVHESFDQARESIFGTINLSNVHDYDSRLKLM